MSVKVITSIEAFNSLRFEWERLQEQDPDVTYYSTFEYISSWVNSKIEDERVQLFIICVYENERIVGIGPFAIQNNSKNLVNWNVLKFIGVGDFHNILIDRDISNENRIIKYIFKFIEESKGIWDRLQLTHIKSNSSLCKYILRQRVYNENLRFLIECPFLNIESYENFDDYKRKSISSSAKKYRNKLKREYNYKFLVIKNNKGNDIFEKISQLHIDSQKHLREEAGKSNRVSLFSDEETSKAIKDIYGKSNNIITFMLVNEQDEIIIYDTCYVYKKVIHSWNTAYNPKFQRYNVGRVMNYEIMNYLFENDIAKIFDFGTGRYPWKFEWADNFDVIYQLDYWNKERGKAKYLSKVFDIREKLTNK